MSSVFETRTSAGRTESNVVQIIQFRKLEHLGMKISRYSLTQSADRGRSDLGLQAFDFNVRVHPQPRSVPTARPEVRGRVCPRSEV